MKHLFAKNTLVAVAASLLIFARPALAQATMTIDNATTAAVNALGKPTTFWFVKGETKVEKGQPVWKFAVVVNKSFVYEVRVHAISGAKIKVERNGTTAITAPAVTLKKAAQLGRARMPGTVWKVEPALFGVTREWSVYVTGNDAKQYEVRLNAATGVVRKVEKRG
jgi:hypothetical protein